MTTLCPPAPWDPLKTAQADKRSKPTGYYQHMESQPSAPKENAAPAVQSRTRALGPPADAPTPEPLADASEWGDSPKSHHGVHCYSGQCCCRGLFSLLSLKKIDQNLEALAKTWHREQPLLLFWCQGRQPAGSGCIPTAAGTPGWRERI